MTSIGRLAGTVAVLVAVVLSFSRLPSEWLCELMQPTDACGERISLAAEHERTAALDRQMKGIAERTGCKEQVMARLVAGELTLFEAAAWFARLAETYPESGDFHRLHPGSSDGEKWCREVISWAHTKVSWEHSAAEADRLCERLEAELQERLDGYGTVELPEG